MSDELRQALRVMRVRADVDSKTPLIYLHDPDTGKPFAAMVQLADLETDKLVPPDNDPHTQMTRLEVGAYDHTHLEGDEDEG